MNKFVAGLLGMTALATTLVIVRQQRGLNESRTPRPVAPAPVEPEVVSLDRLRAVGF